MWEIMLAISIPFPCAMLLIEALPVILRPGGAYVRVRRGVAHDGWRFGDIQSDLTVA